MVIKEGYKQTEIGLIPNDWEVNKLKKNVKLINGKSYKQEELLNSGKYKVLRVGNFFSNNSWYYSDLELEDNKYVFKNDLMYAWSASFGPRFWDEEKTIYHYHIWKIITSEKIDKYFLFHLLEFDKEKILNQSQGGTMFHITKGDMEVRLLPIPPITDQIAIATALSDADGLITGLEKLIAKKRNIKQGAMQQLLQPKEGWEVKKLGEVATIVRGASPRPIEDTKWFDNQSPIGWVRISDVTKSKKVLTETTQKLSDLGVKNSRLVENGNLIMSICATVGRPIFTTFDVCIHDGFVVFRNPHIDKEYLYYFLTFIEDNWSKSGQTGSQMNLNTALINKTEIPFPKSNEEQTRIANIFSDMDAELSALEQKLEKYKKVKLGMMQELLTGKTRLV